MNQSNLLASTSHIGGWDQRSAGLPPPSPPSAPPRLRVKPLPPCALFVGLLLLIASPALGQDASKSVSNKDRKSLAGLPKLENDKLIIHWTEEAKDYAWGLSKESQKYGAVEINPPAAATDAPSPLIREHIAVWPVGPKVYAFSAKTFKWDTLSLPKDAQPRVSLEHDLAVVTSGEEVFHFTAAAGEWTAQNASVAPSETGLRAGADTASLNPLDAAPVPPTEATLDPTQPPQVPAQSLPSAAEPAVTRPSLSPPENTPADADPDIPPRLPLDPPKIDLPSGRHLDTRDIMISWSEDNETLWGFSKSRGKWTMQKVAPPSSGNLIPIVSESVGAVKSGTSFYAYSGQTGKWAEQKLDPPLSGDVRPIVGESIVGVNGGTSFYAYSGQTGRWDVLRLSADHRPTFAVYDEVAVVHDGSDIYTFAGSTGRWSSPQGTATREEPQPATAEITVFTLRNARAADMARILSQLYGPAGVTVAVDERTNSLIVRAPAGFRDTAHAITGRLDEPSPPATASATAKAVTSASVAEQARQFEAAEQEAASLAEVHRAGKATRPGEADAIRSKLQAVVKKSFMLRQRLHEAEAAQLSARVRGIEETIAARQKIADQIVDRRVEDLLNPNLQWDAAQSGPLVPQVDSAAKRSATPATTTAPSPPRITYGTWFPAEAEQIWTALGIKVRPLTGEEAPKPQFRGALKIFEVSDSPAGGLQVGDIIITLQTQGIGKTARKATLRILRGEVTIPVTIEFPSASPQTTKGDNSRTPRPVANALIPGEAEHLWKALGIEVRPVRPDQETEFIPRGSHSIVMLMTDNQQQGLRVGDVITSLQSEAQYGGTRKATLQVRRAEETFPVTIEYAWQSPRPVSVADAPADPAAAMRTLEPPRLAGTVNPKADQVLWSILGVKAETVARKALPNSPFDMGLLVSEVRPNGTARQLQAGDIIVGLHEWATPSKAQLAWAMLQPLDKNVLLPNPTSRTSAVETNIYFLRDDEPRSVRVVLPASPTEGASAAETPRSSDLTSARAYCDKLREQWEAMEPLYNGGRVALERMLQLASDLGPAEVAAAANTDERRKALQQHVERVKRIKKVVEDKFNQNIEPVQNLRAAEAALIKAEAQLAAANQDGRRPSSSPD